MIKEGLLLVPEHYSLQETDFNGNKLKPFFVYQTRLCFTCISKEQISDHSEKFGSITLEFDLEDLKSMGAMPNFYFPSAINESDSLNLGVLYMARLLEIQEFLSEIVQLKELGNKPFFSLLTLEDKETNITNIQLKTLITYLEKNKVPIEQLLYSIRTLASILYPTENLEYNDINNYYEQREWRIFTGLIHKGKEICKKLTDVQKLKIIEIDPVFFTKEEDYPSGRKQKIELCQLLSEHKNKHIFLYVKKIYTTKMLLPEVLKLVAHLSIPVESYE